MFSAENDFLLKEIAISHTVPGILKLPFARVYIFSKCSNLMLYVARIDAKIYPNVGSYPIRLWRRDLLGPQYPGVIIIFPLGEIIYLGNMVILGESGLKE